MTDLDDNYRKVAGLRNACETLPESPVQDTQRGLACQARVLLTLAAAGGMVPNATLPLCYGLKGKTLSRVEGSARVL